MAKLKKETLSLADLTMQVALATNVVLAVVALLLLGLAVAMAGFWENTTPWRQAEHSPVNSALSVKKP